MIKLAAILLGVLLLALPAPGQTLTAVVAGYTLPQNVKALVLLGSATNGWHPQGVSWSGTNAVKFTLSQMWATFGTNEPYGGPALLAVEVQDMDGTYTTLTPETLFDPSRLGTNTVLNFTLSNSVPVLVATSPPPPAPPVVLNFGWNAVDLRLVLCTTTNLAAPMPTWTIAYVWPAALPTNCSWTNDLAPGLRVFRLGVLTTNGLSLLVDTNHFCFTVTN